MEGALMAESIIVQRQVAAPPGAVDLRTRQQVDVLAASQQLTYDQLKAFWDEHQALRRDTGETLGQANEVQTLAEHFTWPTLKTDAEKFVRGCLHCLCTWGEIITPRPWGLASTGKKYVLVLKDDAYKYVWLRAAVAADSDTVIDALL
jgi:hypothetical protein